LLRSFAYQRWLIHGIRRLLGPGHALQRYVPWLAGEMRRNDPLTMVQAGQAISRYDARPWAAQLNVPAASLDFLARTARVTPSAASVAIAQDRISEKMFLSGHGFAVAPFAVLRSDRDVDAVGGGEQPRRLVDRDVGDQDGLQVRGRTRPAVVRPGQLQHEAAQVLAAEIFEHDHGGLAAKGAREGNGAAGRVLDLGFERKLRARMLAEGECLEGRRIDRGGRRRRDQ